MIKQIYLGDIPALARVNLTGNLIHDLTDLQGLEVGSYSIYTYDREIIQGTQNLDVDGNTGYLIDQSSYMLCEYVYAYKIAGR